MRFADVHTRVITACILISILVALELTHNYAPTSTFFLFPAIAVCLVAACSYEFVHLCRTDGAHAPQAYHAIPFVTVTTFLMSLYFSPVGDSLQKISCKMLASGALGMMTALFIFAAVGRRSLEKVRIVSAEVFLCSLLMGFGGTALVSLSTLPEHSLLYTMVGIVIANDTGAYFIGHRFGKNKLSVYISPGKTVEGAIGGLFLGIATGLVLGPVLTPFHATELLVLSILIGVCSQCMDLAKSFVKRIYGAKDSGTILPGHGGFLDRLDGVLGGGIALHIFIALVYG